MTYYCAMETARPCKPVVTGSIPGFSDVFGRTLKQGLILFMTLGGVGMFYTASTWQFQDKVF